MNDLTTRRLATLNAFQTAWAARDIDALLKLMTDDCVYAASIGPEPGQTWRGRAAVREGILTMFNRDETDRAEISNLFIADDRAACEWRYFKRDGAGETLIAHGCDLFRFEGDKIAVKEAFRKATDE